MHLRLLHQGLPVDGVGAQLDPLCSARTRAPSPRRRSCPLQRAFDQVGGDPEPGLSTVVVEAYFRDRGRCRSAEVTVPRLRPRPLRHEHDPVPGLAVLARYSDELAADGLRFTRSTHPYASAFPNGSSLRVPSDEEATLEMWRQHSPQDAAGWERLPGGFESLAATYSPLCNNPQPSWTAFMTALRSVRPDRRDVAIDELAATLFTTTRALGDRYFATPEAKYRLPPRGDASRLRPRCRGRCRLSAAGDVRRHAERDVAGRRRCRRRAIANLLRRRGGTVVTGLRVARVDVGTTGATGVTLADGRRPPPVAGSFP
jgi:phytoene dehydrogenase-like protein